MWAILLVFIGGLITFALDLQIFAVISFIVIAIIYTIVFAFIARVEEDETVIFCFIIGAVISFFTVYHYQIGYTTEAKQNRAIAAVEAEKKAVLEAQPRIVEVPVGNGCTVVYMYSDSKPTTAHHTKFVRCPNASTTSYETYSCGTAKAPKTCTRETVTK